MILKLRSKYFTLKPEIYVCIWLLLAASISPSTCAFDIFLDDRELSPGPLNLKGDEPAEYWEPFSHSQRSESAEPRRRQTDTKSKFLRHLAKVSSNDVDINTNDYIRNILDYPSDMNRLIRDLTKWKQTRDIVKELRRRNNIPNSDKIWKKKQARNINRNLRKQDPLRSYRAAPVSRDPFQDFLNRESGNEDLTRFVSTEQGLEPMGDTFLLDRAVGFEDFALTPGKQSPVLEGFDQFDVIEDPASSRDVRQNGDGIFGDIVSDNCPTSCGSNSDCNTCTGGTFYCDIDQCRKNPTTPIPKAQLGQWSNDPATIIE